MLNHRQVQTIFDSVPVNVVKFGVLKTLLQQVMGIAFKEHHEFMANIGYEYHYISLVPRRDIFDKIIIIFSILFYLSLLWSCKARACSPLVIFCSSLLLSFLPSVSIYITVPWSIVFARSDKGEWMLMSMATYG